MESLELVAQPWHSAQAAPFHRRSSAPSGPQPASRLIAALGVGLLGLAAGCGSSGQSAEVVRPVAEWVVERGGKLEIAGSSLPISARKRIPDGPFRILTINLNETAVTDAELERLLPLEDLVTLQLHSTPITDRGLETVGQLTSLKRLELSNTRVTDKGLEKLAGLGNLERLFLHNTPVTKDGVDALRSQLSGCQVFH